MNFEFLLPIVGAIICSVLTYKRFVPEGTVKKPTFVADEVPLIRIKDETLVLTQAGQMFKVIQLAGQSIAGKRADDLEKMRISRALFFRNVSENKVHLRIVSQKELVPVIKKRSCGNIFLDEICKRWESNLETSFKTKHYILVSSTSESEIDAVIREIFITLSDLEPKILTKSGKNGISPLLTFLSGLCNMRSDYK